MMLFCWEFEGNRWSPVVYRANVGDPDMFKDLPRTEFARVPDDCIGEDGEPMFRRLKERFPLE